MPDIVPLIVQVPVEGGLNVSVEAAVFAVQDVPPLTHEIDAPAVTKSASTVTVIVPNCIVTLELCPVVVEDVTVSDFVFPSSVADTVYVEDAV